MKLPKNFGGQGYGNMMQQMQGAMARAQTLESELADERISVDRGPVSAVFTGTGELQKLHIDKSVVDPDDIEALEDLIVGVIKDGFTQATDLRAARVQDILPNVPNVPGL